MRGCQHRHVGPEHDAVADPHQRAVEDQRVEVQVASAPDGGVAPILDEKGGFDGDVRADAPEDGGVERGAGGVEVVESGGGGGGGGRGEPGVVVVAPGAGAEACGFEGGHEGVVPAAGVECQLCVG